MWTTHRHWLAPALIVTAVISLVGLAKVAGLRVNVTPSMPRGIYRVTDTPLARGELVTLCPPAAWADSGYGGSGHWPPQCPGGARPLLKRLVAVPGDAVAVSADGIRINGTLQPHSAAQGHDRKGRPLYSELRSCVVPPDLGLVLAPVSNSFDGRYFGFVPLEGLHTVIELYIF